MTDDLNQIEQGPREFPIPVDSWGEFLARLGKLNKRAKKLGVETVGFAIVREESVERRHTYKVDGVERTRGYMVPCRVVVMQGKAPRLADWQFLAKVEPLADGKSALFHCVPGTEHQVDSRFHTLDHGTCEHCAKRRRRAETFIVRHFVTGEQRQVGRQCLADFTGINTPEKVAAVLKWLYSFQNLDSEFDGYFGGRFEASIDTREALALTSAYISRFGWVPRSAQMAGATANLVQRHFGFAPADGERAEIASIRADVETDSKHYDRADRTLAWVRTILADKKSKSDYETNLVTLLAGDLATWKHLGLVCSAFPAYQRAMDQQVEYAKRRETNRNSAWVGEPKQRLKHRVVTVEACRAMGMSEWGPTTLVKFRDADGNLLSWFASSDQEYARGTKLTIDATVKEHKEYQGVKETQVTRVRVLEPVTS